MAFDDLVDPYNAPVVGTDQNARAAHEFINHWIHKGASFCRVRRSALDPLNYS